MPKRVNDDRDKLRPALEDHVTSCEVCESDPIDLAAAEALLCSLSSVRPSDASTEALLRMARVELARNAAWVQRRRITAAIALAMLPLPLIAFYGVAVVSFVGSVAAKLLPESVAAYVTTAYAASIVLVYASTYAAVPLLLDRFRAGYPGVRALRPDGVPS